MAAFIDAGTPAGAGVLGAVPEVEGAAAAGAFGAGNTAAAGAFGPGDTAPAEPGGATALETGGDVVAATAGGTAPVAGAAAMASEPAKSRRSTVAVGRQFALAQIEIELFI
ncbi:MAG: hypothetical protein ACM3ZE_14370, partial [Myxococcales bacterium]